MNIAKRTKHVHRYKNLGGKSTVARYQLEKDYVIVHFTDHSTYRYTVQSTDYDSIKKMKELAVAGKGLGTYIEKHLKDRWANKIR